MASVWAELRRRNVVRVAVAYAIASWLILQLTDVLIPLLSLPEWVGKFVLLMLVVGFALALFLAWVYELTPEGLKKEKDVDRSQSITHVTGRKLDFSIMAIMALALVYFAYDKFLLEPTGDEPAVTATTQSPDAARTKRPKQSIAVLPFVNMSSEPEQEFFSDGISEELLNMLAQLPGLRVAARTSSFQFKGMNPDIAKIADTLNVAHILEGSVRKSGTKLRITAQLIKADDGFHLWSHSYDRELDDIFAVQDEIAQAIVSELRLRLIDNTQIASGSTSNAGAYQEYLKGRYFWNLRTSPDLLTAIEHFEAATQLDPEYAEAWAGLADTFVVLPAYDRDDGTAMARYERAREAAQRALAIDPTMGRAYAALGSASGSIFRWQEASDYYERAHELAPNYASGWQWYGTHLAEMGRKDEGLAALERALELDPVSRIINNNYAETLRGAGRTEEAVKHFEYAISLDPEFDLHWWGLGYAHLEVGHFPEARVAFRAYAQLSGEKSELLMTWIDRVENYVTTGQVIEVSPELLEMPSLGRREWALFFILSGQIDAGLDFLEAAADAGYSDAGLYWTLNDYGFRSVWDNPRFIALRLRVGLPEATIK